MLLAELKAPNGLVARRSSDDLLRRDRFVLGGRIAEHLWLLDVMIVIPHQRLVVLRLVGQGARLV